MKFVVLEANVSKFLVGNPNTCWIAILIQPGNHECRCRLGLERNHGDDGERSAPTVSEPLRGHHRFHSLDAFLGGSPPTSDSPPRIS